MNILEKIYQTTVFWEPGTTLLKFLKKKKIFLVNKVNGLLILQVQKFYNHDFF